MLVSILSSDESVSHMPIPSRRSLPYHAMLLDALQAVVAAADLLASSSSIIDPTLTSLTITGVIFSM